MMNDFKKKLYCSVSENLHGEHCRLSICKVSKTSEQPDKYFLCLRIPSCQIAPIVVHDKDGSFILAFILVMKI